MRHTRITKLNIKYKDIYFTKKSTEKLEEM